MIDIIARGMIEESNGDISQLSKTVTTHTENDDIHVTTTDKKNWNSHPNDVQANGNPVIMDNLQDGVPFSEMVVSGKNLLKYPYSSTDFAANGISFTVNKDGTISTNGTATDTVYFNIANGYTISLKGGVRYTLSLALIGDHEGYCDLVMQYVNDDGTAGFLGVNNTDKKTLTFVPARDTDYRVWFRINKGVTVNCIVCPQLELGNTATAFEPPITGRELQVNVSGKNLIPTDYMTKSGTYNGVTFSVNDNGKFDISGTATKGFTLVSFIKNMSLVGGKKYTFSCNKQYDVNTFNCNAIICAKDGTWKYGVTSYPLTIIASDGDYISSFGIWANEGVEMSVKDVTVQLEIGDTATEYETPVGSVTTITPDSNPYIIPNDIRQVEGLNNITVSEGKISVTGVKRNAAIKRIWDEIDEIKTAIIVSNGETE